jgi:signal transduction histidine kinase
MMGRLRAIMSTTAARLSALYLVLFTVCALALVFYMTAQAARFLTTQTKTAITQEVDILSQVYQRAGIAGLVRAIDRRSRVPGANLYLITDQSGVVLAGNVADIDASIMSKEGWTTKPFEYLRFANDGIEPAHQALAQVFVLPNQMRILVGRDLGEPERFRQIVQRSLTLALAMMGLGALLIWFFVGRHALKRIDGVSLASQRIMAGDLNGRLPVTGSGDEFDRLSGNLNQMLGKIAELNEGLKQVSDNIAHDLKTPLTRLRNRAEAALSTRQTSTEYKAALEDMIAQSDQLIRTFNAILMISRLEAGYSSERVEEVDLIALARDVTELYEPLAEDAGASLVFSETGTAKIQGNRELLSQTLSNVIDNAIKYSAQVEKPEIRVAVGSTPNTPFIRISDNGPGIAEDDLERVTERFVRLEKSRNAPGSGLGLSLAKAVMKLHKGELKLSSGGNGLVVEMVFPQPGPQS